MHIMSETKEINLMPPKDYFFFTFLIFERSLWRTDFLFLQNSSYHAKPAPQDFSLSLLKNSF